VEQRIKDGPRRDLEAYLAAVGMLQEALLFFDSHRNHKSSEGAALPCRRCCSSFVEQRIKDGPRRDLEAYLAAVDMLQEALLFFDSHRNYKSSEGAALQARGLMKEAMGMLEADFRQLLANNRLKGVAGGGLQAAAGQ
ncbi:unnamed protein product, partial [Closterium sp. NIES-53]